MALKDQISFTKAQQDQLQHLSDLLHLFHHRNKNQHRRSIWYRHFSIFRKQFSLLLDSISDLNAAPTTHLERSQKKKRDPVLREQIQERLKLWQDILVPKWHFAFSQLVADGRFAVLGLLLVAVLSEVCGVVGVVEHFEEVGEFEVRRIIERFGREEGMDGLNGQGKGGGEGEDVGVAVSREGLDPGWEGVGGKGQRKTGDGKEGNAVRGKGDGRAVRSGRGSATALESLTDVASESERELLEEQPLSSPVKTTAAPLLAEHHSQGKTPSKRSQPPTKTKPASKMKKRKKGDAIDELFSGLG